MRSLSRSTLSSLSLAVALLASTAAHAVALTEPVSPAPFADTFLTGTSSALRPELAGDVIADDIQAFSFQGVNGTIQNRVVRSVSGNLDFYWKINVDASSTGRGISAFRLIDFGVENIKDADWRVDGLGTEMPDTARLFNATPYPTGAINFLFADGVEANESSKFFFLHTNATSFAKTARFDLLTIGDESLSPVYSTFAPAVPEPSTYAMLIAGLAVAGVAMRRRQA